jgi:acetyl esterase/lipase
MPGLPVKMNFFKPVFGDDPLVRRDASPVSHVRPGLPPFLLLSAENDLPTLPASAREFHEALRKRGCEAELHRIPRRNHNSIVFCQIEENDPVGRLIVEFVERRASASH